jgi:hypothetical protein
MAWAGTGQSGQKPAGFASLKARMGLVITGATRTAKCMSQMSNISLNADAHQSPLRGAVRAG